MAKTLLLLIVVASVSALQYIGVIIIIDGLENVPFWATVIATGLVSHSITALIFSCLTGLEQKIEILELKLSIFKIKYLQDKIDAITGINKVSVDPGSKDGDHTAEVSIKVEKDGTHTIQDIKIDGVSQKKGPGKGHMKGKKQSEATKQKIREKAILREQNKRIQKTVEESNKRKARKIAK